MSRTKIAGKRVPAPQVDVRSLSDAWRVIRSQGLALSSRVPTVLARRGDRTRSAPVTMRRGFSLVELLVVIFIMLLITAITIPVIAPAMQNRDVREAARMIDVFINGARSRAKLSGRIYGVMIERTPGQPNAAVTLSYCEQPDPYAGDYASSASFPGMPSSSGGSTILLLGNGGFGAWTTTPSPTTAAVNQTVPAFPLGDAGWIAGPAPSGTGYLTNLAPGDVMTIAGIQYRLWAGEPFIDLDQNGYCNVTNASLPGTPIGVQEPFMDVDGSGTWTPPNPAYIDSGSGYFVQPNAAATSPFPTITWGSASAYITYAPYDPVAAAQAIGAAYVAMTRSQLPYLFGPSPPSVITVPPGASFQSFQFNFLRRPTKTSAPSIQLPGEAVIDLGAWLPYTPPGSSMGNIIAIPGSGVEVTASNANTLGLWATFDCNPYLDPSLNGQISGIAAQAQPPTDPTPIIITFQPSGAVDRVYSWSEIDDAASATTVNWSDWQGRIPAGPIYLLVGRQGLINGDPEVLPRIALDEAPLKPAYNVQDPTTLWVVIAPQSGAVVTAENVGYDLTSVPIPPASGPPTWTAMLQYWSANVYYARRVARDMLDKGGR